MISVIKTGIKKEKECKDCGCLFSYEKEDTFRGTFGDCVICPQCKREVLVQRIDYW